MRGWFRRSDPPRILASESRSHGWDPAPSERLGAGRAHAHPGNPIPRNSVKRHRAAAAQLLHHPRGCNEANICL